MKTWQRAVIALVRTIFSLSNRKKSEVWAYFRLCKSAEGKLIEDGHRKCRKKCDVPGKETRTQNAEYNQQSLFLKKKETTENQYAQYDETK